MSKDKDISDFLRDRNALKLSDILAEPEMFRGEHEGPIQEKIRSRQSKDGTIPMSPRQSIPEDGKISRCTELNNANLLCETHGNNMRFSSHHDGWLTWNGKKWESDQAQADQYYIDSALIAHKNATIEMDQAEIRLQNAKCSDDPAEKISADLAHKGAKKYLKHTESSQSRAKQKNTLAMMSSFPGIVVKQKTYFDSHDYQINVQNGIVDLKTGRLLPHNRSQLHTKITNCNFNPNAKAPRWEKFLSEMLPSSSVIEYLQTFMGYTLTGSTEERKMLILHGSGDNGKSVFFNTLLDMIGEYGTTVADELLLKKRNDAHPTEMADLDGPRLAVNAEISKGATFDEGRIKRIVGGSDSLKARKMQQDFDEFKTKAKLVVSTNNLPTIKDGTNSIWNRLKTIPFGITIDKDKIDSKLPVKLAAELDGIFAWCVRGCLKWHKYGLVEPSEVMDKNREYRMDQDYIGEFLNEHIKYRDGNNTITRTMLFDKYKKWAEDNSETQLRSARSFTQQVQEKLIPGTDEKMTMGRMATGRTWRNIILKNQEMEPDY
jgi:putative DNA primase/helicase